MVTDHLHKMTVHLNNIMLVPVHMTVTNKMHCNSFSILCPAAVHSLVGADLMWFPTQSLTKILLALSVCLFTIDE